MGWNIFIEWKFLLLFYRPKPTTIKDEIGIFGKATFIGISPTNMILKEKRKHLFMRIANLFFITTIDFDFDRTVFTLNICTAAIPFLF